MGKIVVSQNVSLDGVVEDPTGEEGFKHGGWFDQLLAADAKAFINDFRAFSAGPAPVGSALEDARVHACGRRAGAG